MSFAVKISLAAAGLLLVALGAVFLLSSGEEKAIQRMLERGLESARDGDAEAVIELLSPAYQNGEETREQAAGRIRRAVRDRIGPATLDRAAIQVSGENADASLRLTVGVPQLHRSFGLRLNLRKEGALWKVTRAQEVDP